MTYFGTFFTRIGHLDVESLSPLELDAINYFNTWHSEDDDAVIAIVDVRIIDIKTKSGQRCTSDTARLSNMQTFEATKDLSPSIPNEFLPNQKTLFE